MAKGDKKKRTKKVPENETNADKFKRIASARLTNIVEDFRLLGQCSATSGYDYTPKQVENIFEHIDKAYSDLKKMFETGGAKSAKAGIAL